MRHSGTLHAMTTLRGKHILLGITGGIAAYKSATLVRRLRDQGADVRVVMTDAAQQFVTAMTFQALSGNPVHTDLLDPEAEAAMGHIELARWADAILIAPASANTIAKLSSGVADNLLTTLCLASKAPLAIAPAMNHVMWQDDATQQNIKTLNARGVSVFGPSSGSQACGETGEGRMMEPEDLVSMIEQLFSSDKLGGVRVMLTAGPTYEALDPVRFISNRSSGRMGYALAEAAREAGADVELISGPVAISAPDGVQVTRVESTQQMHDAVHAHVSDCDIFIGVAAVADYRASQVSEQKIKKQAANLTIELVRNPDILASVAELDRAPFCVGFAAETKHLLEHARQKLEQKNLNLVIANRVDVTDAGFNSDYNAATVLWRDGEVELEKTSKSQLARQLIDIIAQHYKNRS